MADLRAVEERRFGAIQALKATIECLAETNPQRIFTAGKEQLLDSTKLQTIANRWADKASDVLLRTLELADRISVDALELFEEEPQHAQVQGAPQGDGRITRMGPTVSTPVDG